MSSAGARVRFPDGTIRHAIYSGTSDLLVPGLYETPEEAWDAYRSGADWPEPDGAIYPVIIHSSYGSGFVVGRSSGAERGHARRLRFRGIGSRIIRSRHSPLPPWETNTTRENGNG